MANIKTVGVNVGQNEYDIVESAGTGSPAQNIQLIVNADVVTEQMWAYQALDMFKNYIVRMGWPLP
jgi:hypothetical protein